MTIGYGITLALAVGLLIGYLTMVKKKEFWLTMLYVCVSVVNLGYLLLSVSKSVGFAIFANDVAYLGSVFLCMCMLLTIVRLCGFEIKKAHVIACVSLAALMFAMIATAGFLPWYYKSVTLVQISGGAKLVKDYGPLHPMYMVYLLGYFAAMIVTIVRSVTAKKIGKPKIAGFIAGVVAGNILVWLFEKFITWEFEFLAVTYILSETLLLLLYWMMQDYVHKRDVPEAAPAVDCEKEQSEKLLALSADKGLTQKEREVLELMMAGQSRKEMAAQLHVSENTVKTHVKHIYEKLEVGTREEISVLLQG